MNNSYRSYISCDTVTNVLRKGGEVEGGWGGGSGLEMQPKNGTGSKAIEYSMDVSCNISRCGGDKGLATVASHCCNKKCED